MMSNLTTRILCLVCGAVILIGSAFYIFPLPGHDAIFFMPAAWFYANGKGFINPLVDLACQTDPAGLCRYCFHLPLFPWLIGAISQINPTVQQLFVIAGLLSTIKLLLFDYLLFSRLKTSEINKYAYVLSMLVVVAYSLPTEGRPELLSSLLILGIYAVMTTREANGLTFSRATVLVLLLGLLLSAHLTGYYFTILVISITLLLEQTTSKHKLYMLSLLTGFSVLLGIFIIWLSPNSIDTIQGVINHNPAARHDEISLSIIILYWLANPSYPLIGIFTVIAGFIFYRNSTVRSKKIVHNTKLNNFLLALPCILIAAGLYKFVITTPARIYDMAHFLPVFLLYIIFHTSYTRKKASISFVVLLAFALLLPARNLILFFDNLADGKTYANATLQMQKYANTTTAIVGTHDMWVLCDDLARFREWQGTPTDEVVFMQQARRALPDFVHTDGQLLFDWRTEDKRRIFSVPITNRPQGYSFSVWQLPKSVARQSVLPISRAVKGQQ